MSSDEANRAVPASRECLDALEWICSIANGLTENIEMASIDCQIALAEVYERIRFMDAMAPIA